MKRLIFPLLLLPIALMAFVSRIHHSFDTIVEVRSGEWPINLERYPDKAGMVYGLIFRDEQVLNGNVLDTLSFPNLEQLRYFEKGLTALKSGNNGDVARFSNYSVSRADKKPVIWYVLKDKYGVTSFQQGEADIISKTIRGL